MDEFKNRLDTTEDFMTCKRDQKKKKYSYKGKNMESLHDREDEDN